MRILHIVVTSRMPAFTKNEMRSINWGRASVATLAHRSLRTAQAVASATASSCCGVDPASCRCSEQSFVGFHFGTGCAVQPVT